jgi:6-phosphogluconolactonase/glucosamine-6-phosphate isomerase/deaminase
MPVDNLGRFCDESDKNDKTYEEKLNYFTKFKLNYILLGVGTDGHTASLMPYSDSLKEKIKHVTYTKTKQSNIKRMTLTYNIINNAQHISVLVTGMHKNKILTELLNDRNPLQYPILGVKPHKGNLTFYFDYDAWIPTILNFYT